MFQSPKNTLFLGKNIQYLPQCLSTNDEIVANLHNLHEGQVVITDDQKKGRGQRGNTWESKPGENLTFSMLLKPSFLDVKEQFMLNMVVSLGITDTLRQYLEKGVQIKWPNDIYVNDQKIAGILIENTVQKTKLNTSVIGLGLNVNQTNFGVEQATSLKKQGVKADRNEVFILLLENIEARFLLLKSKPTLLKTDYLSLLLGINEYRMFNDGEDFKGIIRGVDEIGRLVIEQNNERKIYNFKEVAFLF